MDKVSAYATHDDKGHLEPFPIERRATGPKDIQIDIKYCGVCHSDLHFCKNDWGITSYPVVPGHEIIGEVTAIGAEVTRFKIGDRAAIGCLVDSCHKCEACDEHLEQHCLNGFTMTYGSPCSDPGGLTFGGYSKKIVATEDFVLSVPNNLDMSATAPLLCAGITTYSPLKQFNIQKGMTVGIIGLGGLGHMGVKFASAMGAKTVIITTSSSKGEDAKKLGAHDVLLSNDLEAMEKWEGKFNFLLNTIPIGHNIDPYMELLKYNSTMCLVGPVEPLEPMNGASVIFGRKSVSGSLIGGIKETQEMLNFCGKKNIVADVEVIPMDQINDAFIRMQKGDVKYRFVIDMNSIS
jgi:alcohol dehydrogenase (NADP+)